MKSFRVLYMVGEKRDSFRARAPRKGPYVLRRAHYEEGPLVSAKSPYQLWERFRASDGEPGERPVAVGDALECGDELFVCNYWGFDPAEWHEAAATEDGAADDSPADAPDAGT